MKTPKTLKTYSRIIAMRIDNDLACSSYIEDVLRHVARDLFKVHLEHELCCNGNPYESKEAAIDLIKDYGCAEMNPLLLLELSGARLWLKENCSKGK